MKMPAIREREKGRAKGGIIITANKSLREVRIREINYRAVEMKPTRKGDKWRIITVYSQDVGLYYGDDNGKDTGGERRTLSDRGRL